MGGGWREGRLGEGLAQEGVEPEGATPLDPIPRARLRNPTQGVSCLCQQFSKYRFKKRHCGGWDLPKIRGQMSPSPDATCSCFPVPRGYSCVHFCDTVSLGARKHGYGLFSKPISTFLPSCLIKEFHRQAY